MFVKRFSHYKYKTTLTKDWFHKFLTEHSETITLCEAK